MKKINYVCGQKEYGGLNTYSSNLYQQLIKKNEVELLPNKTKMILGIPVAFEHSWKSDLTHFTNQEILSPIVARKRKFIATVHDLTVKKINLFKQSNSKFRLLGSKLYDYKLKALKKAETIIAVSENTKTDITNILGISQDKIHTIYEAADKSFRKIQGVQKQKNTLVYVGNELPHKNLPILFKAIAITKKHIPEIKLLKIGHSGWDGAREKLTALLKNLKLEKNIEFKEDMTNLTEIYNSSEALIFPSLYEGFGLPILEAMACGCPVLCSNTSSMPEVAGKAAEYFNPTNPEEIAEKIMKVLSNEKLKTRLSNKGLERNKIFSWDECARKTLQAYKQE